MKYFLSFLLMAFATITFGQNLISPITITLPANPPANTADWASALPPVMIMAQTKMENGYINGDVQESAILVTIKSGGKKVCGSYTPNNAPQSGFNTISKNWTGASVLALLGQECVLQPGSYELCVQFLSMTSAKVLGESCKPFTIADAKNVSYSPPNNVMPADNKEFTEKELLAPVTFRWTPLVPKPHVPVEYRLRVWQLMAEKGNTSAKALKTTEPIFEKDVDNVTQLAERIVWPKSCPTCKYYWTVEALMKSVNGGNLKSLGTSAPTMFRVSTGPPVGGCFELDTSQYRIECVGQNANGKWVFRVTNMIVKNTNTNSTGCTGNSGLINPAQINYVVPTVAGTFTVSNIQPSSITGITTSSPKSFSFDMESNSPTPAMIEVKTQFANVCTDNAGNISECTASPRLKFEDLPSCKCTYCDNVKIDVTPTPIISQSGNNVKFTQKISVSSLPSNATLNVKDLYAEIIYVDITKDSAQCYACDKNSKHFGKFVSANISNTRLQGDITGPGNPYNPTGQAIFSNIGMAGGPNNPAPPNPGTPVTNATMSFEIAMPDLNRCCKDTVSVCIKYTIVTADCKSCSVTKCYVLPRSN
jgi:hypothetical protein